MIDLSSTKIQGGTIAVVKVRPPHDSSAFQDLSHLLSVAFSKQLQHRWPDPCEIIILLSVEKNLGAVLKGGRSKCMFRMSMRLSEY
jgi:hypothetical protein